MPRSDVTYKILQSPQYVDFPFTLRPVSDDDIEFIRQWRNEQMSVLRQSVGITRDGQEQYFNQEVWPHMSSSRPPQVLFAIERNEKLIGYGGLVHIDWSNCKAEVSFLLSPEVEASDEEKGEAFRSFLGLISRIAFEEMGLNRIFAETYSFRRSHISILENAGFTLEGVLRENVRLSGMPTDCEIHALVRSDQGRWV